jgi:hypothetical protein
MDKSYNIDKTLTFSEATGYWTLTLGVTSSSQVSPCPFLLEKAVLGTGSSTTLSSDIGLLDDAGNSIEQQPQYLRTLLESESATQRLISEATTYDKFTWVQYRSNAFSKTFYTYEQAEGALASILSILKSNARIYGTIQAPPRLVAVNLSSKEKEPVSESVELTKGDTISLQLINGPTDSTVISDGDWIIVSREASSIRRKSNSHVITITSDSMSYLGLKSNNTGSEHRMDVSMSITPLEGTTSEIIR